jgi:hypothetical protein
MEDQIRKAVREEIARALGAVGAVADGASQATGEPIDIARGVIANVMERVARDVLANTHPALEPEHGLQDACTCGHDRYRHRAGECFACDCPGFTEHTASTEPVHTITAVPERARASCTCHRHTHVMGYEDGCGAPFCYCRSPIRAQAEHTDVHASTEDPRTCPTCKHGVHESGKCTMHVYLRGVACPCPCLEWVRPEVVVNTGARRVCTLCSHDPHGAENCGHALTVGGLRFTCGCGGRA